MKKLLVVMVISLMMTGLSMGAYALQADWQVDLTLTDLAGAQYMGVASVGAAAGLSADGVDMMDGAYPDPAAGTYELDIINGAMGPRSMVDLIDVPAAATDVDLWTLKVVRNGATAGAYSITGTFQDFGGAYPLNSPDFFVYLFAGQLSKAEAAAATPLWTGSLANLGAFQAGLKTPVVPLAAAGADYYTLWAGAAIPEPGSMLALFSGLVGLVGFGIRRRR